MSATPPLTELLRRSKDGDAAARQELERQLYAELRELAGAHMARQREGHTLQSTALVHEAWMKLEDPAGQDWANRRQFFALASQVMRSILVDHARARRSEKRGGGALRVTLHEERLTGDEPEYDLVDLDAALGELHVADAELGQLVELKFFGGMTHRELAEHLGKPLRSIERSVQVATLWLRDRLGSATN